MDFAQYLLNFGAVSDDVLDVFELYLALELFVFIHQNYLFGGVANEVRKVVGVEGLGDVVESAVF